jgi:hypothetical protein
MLDDNYDTHEYHEDSDICHDHHMNMPHQYNPYIEVSVDPLLLSTFEFETLADKMDITPEHIKQARITQIFSLAEQHLTDRQLQIFILRYFFGLKEQDISQYIRTSKTFKMKIFPNKKLAHLYQQCHSTMSYKEALNYVKHNRAMAIRAIQSHIRSSLSQPYVALVLKRIEKKIKSCVHRTMAIN